MIDDSEQAEINARVVRLGTQETKTKKRLKVVEERLAVFEKTDVEEYLDQIRADVVEVHSQYQMLIMKTTTLTELRYFLKGDIERQSRIISGAISCFDMPDEWWRNTEAMTLLDLCNTFDKIGKNQYEIASKTLN